MDIAVFGTGCMGLVMAACLAEQGHRVHGVDNDTGRVARLRHGVVPFLEPELESIVRRNLREGRLVFGTDLAEGVRAGQLLMVAVDTPPGPGGAADIRRVLEVARAAGRHMDGYRLLVINSAAPVGTAEAARAVMASELRARGVELPHAVASNPVFLREGHAVADFERPDRIVIGTDDALAARLLAAVYEPFEGAEHPVLHMDLRSAELSRFAANAMLATRLSFMNEMALLADRLGADVEQVRRAVGADPRIGPGHLRAGCGWGGPGMTHDTQALLALARASGTPLQVVAAAERANVRQFDVLVQRIMQRFGGNLQGRRLAVWGLSFKAGTDELCEAPACHVVNELCSRGAHVAAHDPRAMPAAHALLGSLPGFSLSPDPRTALHGADALVILTDWDDYRKVDPDVLRHGLRTPLVFDGRNLFEPAAMRRAGIDYRPIGRGALTRSVVRSDDFRPLSAPASAPATYTPRPALGVAG